MSGMIGGRRHFLKMKHGKKVKKEEEKKQNYVEEEKKTELCGSCYKKRRLPTKQPTVLILRDNTYVQSWILLYC